MGKCILYINEKWKNIEGYEGLYQISNCGRVKSLNYNRTGEEQIMKQTKNNKGYLKVPLCKNGKMKTFLVHRLVANAFLPNPNGYEEINHIDECKTKNIVTNLEWCDHLYNMNYGTARERTTEKQKGVYNTKLSKTVLQIDKTTNEIVKEWPSAREIQRQLGYSQASISMCCTGRINTAYGFIWKFKESAA